MNYDIYIQTAVGSDFENLIKTINELNNIKVHSEFNNEVDCVVILIGTKGGYVWNTSPSELLYYASIEAPFIVIDTNKVYPHSSFQYQKASNPLESIAFKTQNNETSDLSSIYKIYEPNYYTIDDPFRNITKYIDSWISDAIKFKDYLKSLIGENGGAYSSFFIDDKPQNSLNTPSKKSELITESQATNSTNMITIRNVNYNLDDFKNKKDEEQKDLLKSWFYEHYEDPVHSTPYISKEGGYQYLNGGPYDAGEEIYEVFGEFVSDEIIKEVVSDLETECTDWAKIRDESWYDDDSIKAPDFNSTDSNSTLSPSLSKTDKPTDPDSLEKGNDIKSNIDEKLNKEQQKFGFINLERNRITFLADRDLSIDNMLYFFASIQPLNPSFVEKYEEHGIRIINNNDVYEDWISSGGAAFILDSIIEAKLKVLKSSIQVKLTDDKTTFKATDNTYFSLFERHRSQYPDKSSYTKELSEFGIEHKRFVESDFPNTSSGNKTVVNRDATEKALNVETYANVLAKHFINSTKDFNFGLLGNWGRGKTFLLKEVEEKLKGSNYEFVWFDAWKYKKRPQVWAHLYETFYGTTNDKYKSLDHWYEKVVFFYQQMVQGIRFNLHKSGYIKLLWGLLLLFIAITPIIHIQVVEIPGLENLLISLPILGGIITTKMILNVKSLNIKKQWKKVQPATHSKHLGLQDVIGKDLKNYLLSKDHAPNARYRKIAIMSVVLVFFLGRFFLEIFDSIRYFTFFDLTSIFSLHIWLEQVPHFFLWGALYSLIIWTTTIVLYNKEGKKTILVVDNLDRCQPDEMLEIIESVYLLLEDSDIQEVLKTVMLIDEGKLRYAIAEKYCCQIMVEKHHINNPYICNSRQDLKLIDTNLKVIEQNNHIVDEQIAKMFISYIRLNDLTLPEVNNINLKLFNEYAKDQGDDFYCNYLVNTIKDPYLFEAYFQNLKTLVFNEIEYLENKRPKLYKTTVKRIEKLIDEIHSYNNKNEQQTQEQQTQEQQTQEQQTQEQQTQEQQTQEQQTQEQQTQEQQTQEQQTQEQQTQEQQTQEQQTQEQQTQEQRELELRKLANALRSAEEYKLESEKSTYSNYNYYFSVNEEREFHKLICNLYKENPKAINPRSIRAYSIKYMLIRDLLNELNLLQEAKISNYLSAIIIRTMMYSSYFKTDFEDYFIENSDLIADTNLYREIYRVIQQVI